MHHGAEDLDANRHLPTYPLLLLGCPVAPEAGGEWSRCQPVASHKTYQTASRSSSRSTSTRPDLAFCYTSSKASRCGGLGLTDKPFCVSPLALLSCSFEASPRAPSRAEVRGAKDVVGHPPCSFGPCEVTRLCRLDLVYLHLSWLRVLVDDPPHHPGSCLLLVDLVEFVFLAAQVKVSFVF